MAIEEINGIGDMIMTIEGFEENFISAPAKASSRFYSAPAKASSRFYSAPAKAKATTTKNSKFRSAPAKAKQANFKPVIAKIKENQRQIKKNQLTLRDEINQLNAKFRDLYNWVKQAEKTVSTPQEKKVLNEKMAELTNVAKLRANKLTRYKLYDKANIFLNYAIKNVNEGKTEDIVKNIAGATIIGKYSEQFKNVENLAKKQDELDKAKRDIQIKEQEAMSLEKLAQETGEPEYMNEATDIKEEISNEKQNVDNLENEVNIEEKQAESIFGGENEFSESGAENMTLEGIDDIDDFEGFWDTLGNIVKAPIKAVQWVGKKTFDGVGWVAKNVGGIAGKLLGGVFGGGGAPMPMPMDTGMPQQESGIGKWLLIGGAGIVGLGAVYFLTKKD